MTGSALRRWTLYWACFSERRKTGRGCGGGGWVGVDAGPDPGGFMLGPFFLKKQRVFWTFAVLVGLGAALGPSWLVLGGPFCIVIYRVFWLLGVLARFWPVLVGVLARLRAILGRLVGGAFFIKNRGFWGYLASWPVLGRSWRPQKGHKIK